MDDMVRSAAAQDDTRKGVVLARCCATLILLGLASTCWGCSLLFVNTAAPPAPRDCTTSKLAPILDSAMTTYQVVRTGYAVASRDEVYEPYGVAREADIAVGATLTAVFLGSAIYGYIKTAECGRVRAEFVDPANDIFENELGPMPLRATRQSPRLRLPPAGVSAVDATCAAP